MLGLSTFTVAALLPGSAMFAGKTPDLMYVAVAIVSAVIWMAFLPVQDALVQPATWAASMEGTSLGPVSRSLLARAGTADFPAIAWTSGRMKFLAPPAM